MGGVPGCSIEHYIVKMLNFILTSMDGKPNIAVLAVPVNFSKAFNRMLHSVILLFRYEERKHALTKIVKNKKKVESDHNPLITTFKMTWNKSKVTNQNSNMFNIKNRKGQHKFKEETSNNTYLSSVFDDENGDLNVQTNVFLKRLNKIIYKCFKKYILRKKWTKKQMICTEHGGICKQKINTKK